MVDFMTKLHGIWSKSKSGISVLIIWELFFWFPFRQYGFVAWTISHWTFARRFYTRNNRALNVCMTVLRREQKGIERLHDGFASCTKGLWTFAWRFCDMYKRSLNVCMEVLHVCKKALKLVQGAFARVQKGFERCKNGLVHGTIWAWSYFMTMTKITSQIICLFSTLLYR